ncbi:NAD(P)H-hydrate epimerase [Tateyamaria sp.]|uniref:NAD(P)H-hydrate epimerase n=1 Tax=Tateyamaria sp. TaxID=1929288 RepID=UPI00329C09FF
MGLRNAIEGKHDQMSEPSSHLPIGVKGQNKNWPRAHLYSMVHLTEHETARNKISSDHEIKDYQMNQCFPNVGPLPEIDTKAMIEVDRLMMEDYQISLFQMMENAGRCLAILARDIVLGDAPENKRVVVLAGAGGNGGGALTAARRLATWGAKICVITAQGRDKMADVPKAQLDILLRLENVVEMTIEEIDVPVDVILDGLIGYSLTGAPRGQAATLIAWANENPAPTLALDVPSGYDAHTGTIAEPAIRATATLTIALPKLGMQSEGNAQHIGSLYCADISVPPELYHSLTPSLDIGFVFKNSDIVRL